MNMNMKKNCWLHFSAGIVISWFVFIFPAYAQEDAPTDQNYTYVSLKPNLITHFASESSQLGYITVDVDLMVNGEEGENIVKQHEPLIRDVILETLNQESESRIKSAMGKEAIRQALLKKLNQALYAETGENVITDLLFTNYLYQ